MIDFLIAFFSTFMAMWQLLIFTYKSQIGFYEPRFNLNKSGISITQFSLDTLKLFKLRTLNRDYALLPIQNFHTNCPCRFIWANSFEKIPLE